MDLGDCLYAGAVLLIGIGAGLFDVGAGLVSAGLAMLIFPIVSWLRSGSKGPEKP